jgi:hypothetical protein
MSARLINILRHKLIDDLPDGVPIPEERVQELREIAGNFDEEIEAAVSGIEVIADYLYLHNKNDKAECMFNEASWILKKLAGSISAMQTLQADCLYMLHKRPPNTSKRGKAAKRGAPA